MKKLIWFLDVKVPFGMLKQQCALIRELIPGVAPVLRKDDRATPNSHNIQYIKRFALPISTHEEAKVLLDKLTERWLIVRIVAVNV